MSVEKLVDLIDESTTSLEQNPYTQICNTVIESIKDNDAYRLYCYLASKSREWKVIKEWTAKICGVGERKAKQCWSYLERCGLISYFQIRDEHGKFIKHDIRVLNGTKFKPDEPFIKPTGAETAPVEKLSTDHRCKNPPSGETTRVDFAPLLNKEDTNKELKRNKDKSFCRTAQKEANSKKHDWAAMKNEAAAIAESEQHKKAAREASPLVTDLVNKVMVNNQSSHVSANTEWGPGHPTWESIHGRRTS